MKVYPILITAFSLLSCGEVNTVEQKQESVLEEKNAINDEIAAKQWLIESIETYFSADNPDMEGITSTEYYQYKMDAMNVDLDIDGSLTKQQFHDKWKGQFDPSKAGIGAGFLISGQDWSTIKVEKCELIRKENERFLFDVVLKDQDFQATYPSQIWVKKVDGTFKISDVLEKDF